MDWIEVIFGVERAVPFLVMTSKNKLRRKGCRADERANGVDRRYKDRHFMVRVCKEYGMGNSTYEVASEFASFIGHKKVDVVHAEEAKYSYKKGISKGILLPFTYLRGHA